MFPADFYVIDMNHDNNVAPMLLGRPFLMTAKTKIDVSTGSLTLEFEGEVVKFNIFDCMKYPCDDNSLNFIDVVEPIVESVYEMNEKDPLEFVLANSIMDIDHLSDFPFSNDIN